MKSFLFSILCTMLLIPVLGQNKISWKNGGVFEDKNEYVKSILPSETAPWTVFFSKMFYSFYSGPDRFHVSSYSEDFSQSTPLTMPAGSPDVVDIFAFNDMLVIYGGEYQFPDKVGIAKGNIVQQKVMFLDVNLNIIETYTFNKDAGDLSSFDQLPSVIVTHDETLAVFIFEERKANPSRTMIEQTMFHIIAFDNTLKKIVDIQFNSKIEDFPGGVFAKENILVNPSGHVNIFVKNTPLFGDSLKIHGLDLDDAGAPTPWFSHLLVSIDPVFQNVLRKDTLYFFGLYSTRKSKSRQLFSYYWNVRSNDPPVIKSWSIDDAFRTSYGLKAKQYVTEFTQFVIQKDGVLLWGEPVWEMNNLFNGSTISMFKFDFQGNLKWIKCIQKTAGGVRNRELAASRFFPGETDLRIFYADAIANVNNTTDNVIKSDEYDDQCLVYSIISSDGKERREIININQKSGVVASLPSIMWVGGDRYIVSGTALNSKDKTIYFGDFSLN